MAQRKLLGGLLPVLIGALILALFIVGLISGPLGTTIFGKLNLPSWLQVPQPSFELPPQVVFNVFGWPITNTMFASWITMITLIILAYVATRKMKLMPSGFQNAFEFIIESLLNFCESIGGEENGRRFFPLVATIFLFIVTNAWTSLIPGFNSISWVGSDGETVSLLRSANTDINVPLAFALASFIAVEYFGIRFHGIKYLGKFVNVGRFIGGLGKLLKGEFKDAFSGLSMGIIDIFVGLLESMSELVRIASFTFRLFGNMTAGEILILIASFLVPWIFGIPFYGLELLIGFVQALVFAGLTLVFLTIAAGE